MRAECVDHLFERGRYVSGPPLRAGELGPRPLGQRPCRKVFLQELVLEHDLVGVAILVEDTQLGCDLDDRFGFGAVEDRHGVGIPYAHLVRLRGACPTLHVESQFGQAGKQHAPLGQFVWRARGPGPRWVEGAGKPIAFVDEHTGPEPRIVAQHLTAQRAQDIGSEQPGQVDARAAVFGRFLDQQAQEERPAHHAQHLGAL